MEYEKKEVEEEEEEKERDKGERETILVWWWWVVAMMMMSGMTSTMRLLYPPRNLVLFSPGKHGHLSAFSSWPPSNPHLNCSCLPRLLERDQLGDGG